MENNMKIVKEIDFALDVEKFVSDYGITKETTDEQIKGYIYDYLCGCDDNIYYSVSVEDVYKEYINQIKEEAKNYTIDLLVVFDDMVNQYCLGTKKDEWAHAIPLIREKLSK